MAADDLTWCRLTSLGLLRFEGPDAQSFLQAQLTSDVAVLNAANSQYSGYCTSKGRLLAFFLLWQRGNAYEMQLPRELCEAIRKRLSMYILRAKVKAFDVSADHLLFGAAGSGAARVLDSIAGSCPAHAHDAVHTGDVSLLKLPVNRYLIVANAASGRHVEQALSGAAGIQPESWWSQQDIEAGIPVVTEVTQEQFVPQAVNLDVLGAVSFDKGCYPGQEIVARTRYLGKIKQRMVHARIAADQTPRPGDKLYSARFGDQASGMIVSAVQMDQAMHDVLAVVQTADDRVHWQSPAGPLLEMATLPYTLP